MKEEISAGVGVKKVAWSVKGDWWSFNTDVTNWGLGVCGGKVERRILDSPSRRWFFWVIIGPLFVYLGPHA